MGILVVLLKLGDSMKLLPFLALYAEGKGRAYERFLSNDPFRFNINDLRFLQGDMGDLITSWDSGIDNVIVGLMGFNSETFFQDLTWDIPGLTQQFADLNLGDWNFDGNTFDFNFNPEFFKVIEIVTEIIQNSDQFKDTILDVLDQLYIDFEQISGDVLVFDEATSTWSINFDALQSQAAIEKFLEEVVGQLSDANVTLEEIQGWLVLDPLQELFDQMYEQLNDEQYAIINDILAEIGMPDLGQLSSIARSPRPTIEFVKESKLSLKGVMDVVQNYEQVNAEMQAGKSVEKAVKSATGTDYFAQKKPDNDPTKESCPEMKWKGKKATKLFYRGRENGKRSYVIRQTILNNSDFHPNIRQSVYTGFFMFSRRYCGSDFFNGLSDGSIQLGIFDYDSNYEIKHKHTRIDGSKGSSVTFQYFQEQVGKKDAPWDRKNGNSQKKDQFFLSISNVPDSFDSSKEAACFNLLTAVLPNDFDDATDWTQCASTQKDAGF